MLVNVNYTESNRQEGMTERIDMNVLVNVNGLEPKSSGEMTGTHNRSGQGGGGGRARMSMYLLHKQRWNGELKGRKVDRRFLYTRGGRRTDGQEAGWGVASKDPNPTCSATYGCALNPSRP